MINQKIQYLDVELINNIMKVKEINEKDMAKLMEVSQSTIKRFLGGANQKHLSGKILYKLSKALNVSAQSLIHKDFL